jgi:Uma2 family endonuclease
MAAALALEIPPASRPIPDVGRGGGDQLITLYGVGWGQYASMRDALSERRDVRMTYLEGTLEIMTTGVEHELTNGTVGRLVEAYADEMRIALYGHGRATFRREARARGLEPDECYALRALAGEDDVPDLAIEVIFTSGTVDKLKVYAGLEVPEVWLWKGGKIAVYWLGEGGYEARTTSRLLPDLDVEELATFIQPQRQPEAVWAYRDRLRERAAMRAAAPR